MLSAQLARRSTHRPARRPQPTARAEPRWLPVRVAVTRQLGPTLRRITLVGEGLTTFTPLGPDEYFGLLIPPPGGDVPALATGPDPRAAVAALPATSRPHLRWYTVRHHRPHSGEVDVDMVTHGDNGRASHWAESARPGARVGFRECAALYAPPADATQEVLVGDETALPALGAILESTPQHRGRRAFIEVPHPQDIQDLPYPEPDAQQPGTAAGITWVVRHAAAPGGALLAALASAELDAVDYAWVCGEAGTVAAARTHLIRQAGVPRERITHSGYWCRGRARP